MGKSETKKVVEQTKQESKKESKKELKKELKPEQKSELEQQQNCDKFDEQMTSAQDECGKLKELLKSVSTSLKKLQATHKADVKKMKTKKSKRSGEHKPTGFARTRPVTGKLADFLGVQSGAELSGPEITKKVWAELKSRNLTYQGDEKKGIKGDQRVLRVDDEVSQLFNIPKSVNKSTDCTDKENGFNFGNLQKYIKNAMGGAEQQQTPAKKSEKVATK
jgi:hypothetical protein